ncbi:D-amino acid aminotransferase [Ideonella dechloratans]|uniref:D-amino acid aminotransferase n=1 Tax=Ideonella dechloratans TaxID=36863 RepID=A0A643FE51_IDEDE|nr:aminotransferase class IV [Ideonella dechloratans]KAB0583232.1 D-amino acid aminotransferase [Ideonella dechloratans]UFU10584.1 aminotransferase class IV [Ideonella dechloratans]
MSAPLPDYVCDLDGELLPLSQARVSVLDRGFLLGDGVYEALPVYGRRLFRFDDHMARLARNLDRLRIPASHDAAGWEVRVRRLVAAQPFDDQLIYLQVTRGVALREHAMLPGLTPTVFLMSTPLKPVPAEWRHHGAACVTAPDLRWSHGDIKSISLLGNVMARQVSVDAGAAETILLREGEPGGPWLTEGASSNVWIVQEGALLGPPPGPHVLPGIRVGLLRELCEEAGLAFNLRPICEADLRAADEVLLSSTGKEVLAVTRLDGEPVGHGALRGKPGPVYGRLYEAYQRAKAEQAA